MKKAAFIRMMLSIIVLITMGMGIVQAAPSEKRVLLIMSYHPDYPTAFKQIEGVTTGLAEAGFERPELTLDIEFMDSKRFFSEELEDAFYQSLKKKLAKLPPYDLILTADDNAAKSAIRRRVELFGDVPLVFFGVNDLAFAVEQDKNQLVTGVIEKTSVKDNLELAARLLPGQPLVFAVGATPSAQAILAAFRQEAGDELLAVTKVLSLADMSFDELKASLATFPEQSSLVYVNAIRDKAGVNLSLSDSFKMVRSNFAGRIYHPMLPGIGEGILIGGIAVSQLEQGKTAASMAAALLKGKSPAAIPVLRQSPNIPLFDYALIKQYDIARSKLPEDSLFVNEPLGRISLTRQELEWIEAHPDIALGTDRGWKPYVVVGEDGRVSGVEADLIARINDITGVNIRLVTGEWSEIVKKAKARDLDGLAASARYPEREAYFLFSDSPYSVSKYIFTRSAEIMAMGDLAGKRVGLRQGNWLEEKLLQQVPGIIQVPVQSDEALISLLASEQVDAVIGSTSVRLTAVEKIIADFRTAFIVPESETKILYSIRKDWFELHSIINKALAAIPLGERLAILEKWGGISTAKKEAASIRDQLTGREKAWLNEHPIIHLGGGIMPPIDGLIVKGEIKGMARAYSDLIASKLGIHFEHSAGVWADVHKQAKQHEIDGIRLVIPNRKREDYLNFTEPYAESSFGIVTRNVDAPPTELDKLTGKRVAVLKASYIHNYLAEHHPDITLVYKKSFEAGIDAVFNGEADACIGALAMVEHIVRKKSIPGLRVTSLIQGIPSQPFTIGIREDWPELVVILDKVIASITPQEHAALAGQWLPARAAGSILEAELSEQEKEWLKAHPAITMCVDPAWMPFEQINKKGEYEGMVADYMALISKRLGVTFQLHPTSTFEESLTKLKAGACTILSSWAPAGGKKPPPGLSTKHYLSLSSVLAVHQDEPYIHEHQEFSGRRIGAVRNYPTQVKVTKNFPEAQMVLVENVDEGVRMIANGELDAFMATQTTISFSIYKQNLTNVKIGGVVPGKEFVRMVVNNKEPNLVAILDKAIESIAQEDRQRINNRWFSFTFERGIDYGLLWKVSFGFLLVMALTLAWNHVIRRQKAFIAESEARLRESEEKYHDLYDKAPGLMISVDVSNKKIVECNDKLLLELGLSRDEVIGKEVFDLYHPDSVDAAHKAFKQFMETDEVHGAELQVAKKDGRKIDVLLDVTARVDKKTGKKYTLSILRDITDRKQLEQNILHAKDELEFQVNARTVELTEAVKALGKSENQFKTLVSNIPGVTYRCNLDEQWTMNFISDEVSTLSGYPAEEFIGNRVRSFASIIYPDDKEMVKAAINAAVKRHQPFIIEYRIMHADGGVRWVYDRGQAIFDKNKNENVISLDGVIFDITERKNTEDALHKAKEEATQQRERLARLSTIQVAGELATSFAHELNQPLAAIANYAQAAQRRLESGPGNGEKLSEILDKIRTQAHRSGDVIANLRKMIKQQETNKTMVDINALINETIELAENEIAQCGCRVEVIPVQEITEIEVDKIQIQQVILNLIRNAIDEVCRIKDEEKKLILVQLNINDKNEMEVSVIDSGKGVPDSEVVKLFEPFYTTKETGMGIGLSICQTIVEVHGGKMWYSPNPAGGAIFHFTLPINKA